MSGYGKIRRYSLIIEKINRGQKPKFEEIKNYLHNHGFEVSRRTVERDIERIRVDFGIEIMYSWADRGYYIDHDASMNIKSFFSFLEMANTAQLLHDSIHENKKSFDVILFDSSNDLKGIENLGPILRAVKEKKKVKFTHRKFQSKQAKEHIIEPYLLKEYQKRWYVVGLNKSKKMITFGIDRIEELEVTTEPFIYDESLEPKELFTHTIGVIHSENPVQEVILSFTPLQGKYIKTLPLHHSQKILIDNDTEFRISIMVSPNFELNQIILKHGNTVKVMKPTWLVNKVKGILQEALERY